MKKRVRLEAIPVRDLNRNPGEVLARVRRGERFIVCWHRHPVATLQPLDGFVVEPFAGGEYDVYGSPLGDAHDEATKLSDVQRDLLTRGIRRGRIVPVRVDDRWPLGDAVRALNDLNVLGLAIKTQAGWTPTGRGWMLHEALVGLEYPDGDRTRL